MLFKISKVTTAMIKNVINYTKFTLKIENKVVKHPLYITHVVFRIHNRIYMLKQ